METITFTGVLLRFLFALVLVLATFNPTGLSYAHWFARHFPQITPPIVLAGLVLLAGWIVFVRATIRSLAPAASSSRCWSPARSSGCSSGGAGSSSPTPER